MSAIILFEEKQVRRAWSDDEQKWYFAIVDVIAVLTGSPNPQVYWRVMKKRFRDEGNQTVTNCNALKNAKGKKSNRDESSRFENERGVTGAPPLKKTTCRIP